MIPALLLGATPVVGIAALRRTRSTADFFVAGRRPGAFRAGLAVPLTIRPPAARGFGRSAPCRHGSFPGGAAK